MVKRKRRIKMFGDSRGIHLSVEDVKDFHLEVNDRVDIADIYKIENED